MPFFSKALVKTEICISDLEKKKRPQMKVVLPLTDHHLLKTNTFKHHKRCERDVSKKLHPLAYIHADGRTQQEIKRSHQRPYI